MEDPLSDPSNTREAILGAAFRALREHGYADLTIKRIGEEFDKSPSLVYHHYDGKDELLVDLLEFLLDRFESGLSADAFDRSPRARLDGYLSAMIDPASVDAKHAPDARFLAVVVELRAQAVNDEAYRTHFDRSDRVFQRFLTSSVREVATSRETPGDRRDTSEPVPPAEVAATLQACSTGAMLRWATTNDREWVGSVRTGIDRYLSMTLPNVDPDA